MEGRLVKRLVLVKAAVCIWLYHPVPGCANQFVSKMLAKMGIHNRVTRGVCPEVI